MRQFSWVLGLAIGGVIVAGCITDPGAALLDAADKDSVATAARQGSSSLGDSFGNGGVIGGKLGAGNSNSNSNQNDNGADNNNGNENENENGNKNGNDNGNGNENDNGNDNGACADGSITIRAELFAPGAPEGQIDYRELPGGCFRFRVRVDGFPQGSFDVTVAGIVVGQIATDDRGRGELEWDTEDGTFPADFPALIVGDSADVGGIASGAFALNCPAMPQSCNANGNGNDNGNGNTNGNGNANDNGGL